jgi:arabinose-5-phosphate isomerase
MGKAGIIARKVAATFSSTGTAAVFLHPGEAQHGDLGMLSTGDVLLVFSNSGKTREAIELVHLARKLLIPGACRLLPLHPMQQSALAQSSHIALSIGQVQEACSLGMAPTSSTTAMLALGDVLCVLVMEEKNFSQRRFFKTPPRRLSGAAKAFTLKTDNSHEPQTVDFDFGPLRHRKPRSMF